MANLSYIIEAAAENFRTLVLENSDKGPEMFYFWSPRAGLCMKLIPRLISNYYAGAMEQLLKIVRRDREFREDAGRKGLLATSYRSLLTEALH